MKLKKQGRKRSPGPQPITGSKQASHATARGKRENSVPVIWISG
jgi:hypothetical protein